MVYKQVIGCLSNKL